jgi:hypothetical protein
MKKNLLAAVCFISGLFASGPASAAIVTLDYDVTASQFGSTRPGGNPPPFDPVTFSYSLTFDTSSDIQHSTAGLYISNLPFASRFPVNFSYRSSEDQLAIGSDTDLGSLRTQGGGYGFIVNGVSSSQTHSVFSYNDNSRNGDYLSFNLAATPHAAGPGAPAPEVGVGLLSALAAGLALLLSRTRMPTLGFASREFGRRST